MAIAKKRVAWLSVGSNTLLTAGKIVAGVMTGSVSILAEAAHSGIDLLAACIATFSVHYSDQPPDPEHPYGHEKIENVSGVVEGLLILGAAGWMIFESVQRLRHGAELGNLGPGLAVMAVSAGMNLIVATLLKHSAKESRSVALEADSAHLYTDVYTSLGVFVGLGAIVAAKRLFEVELKWLDPVAALLVAMMIIYVGYEITAKSFWPLMDAAVPAEEEAGVRETIKEFEAEGADFHKLRVRRAGPNLHLDLHMGWGPGTSLEQGHARSHALKARIQEQFPGAEVLIHVEPSAAIEPVASDDETYRCIMAALVEDRRVAGVRELSAQRYKGELRVEAELNVNPAVTLSESRALADDLRAKVHACVPQVREVILSLNPGDGWREAIHEDDQARITELLGEHEGMFTGIHELRVTSSGGYHRVDIRMGVPRMLPLVEAHAVSLHLKADIAALFPDQAVIDVHLEPCQETCDHCHAACPERTGKKMV
jgi:cation diffusion facilitator family transporter